MLKRPSSSLALFISVVLIAQVALAGPAESNFWRDRQNRGARPIQSAPQLAMAVGPAPLLNALPSARAVLGAAPIATLNSGSADVASDLASAVPLGNATVQESFSGHAPAPPVLILQDVHLNNEAQTNLAATLQALFATGRIEKVGVEGAFARFDFSKMRSWPDRKLREAVAHAFLEKNLLAAPSYVGLTSDKEAPPMIGVDDRAGYDANVAAYRRSLGAASKTAAGLANLKEALAAASRTRFSPALAKIDAMRGAYLRGEVPIGRYVQSLAMVGTPGEEVRQFLDAYGLEMSLDFPSVERERRQVLERLTESLSKEELKTLLDRSLAFRMGRVGFGDYYGDLKNLCARRGVNLEQTPSFDRYVRYVILCDRIRPARLLPKVKDLEKDVFSALAKTPEESELVALNERVALMEKLTRFSLSPEEWKEYRDSSGSPAEAASAASRLLGRTVKADVDLSPFEDFYRQADGRSEKIIDNILGGATGPRALVVGGFHTAEIAARLRSREVSYLVVTPKLTKVDESTGSAYLSVFAQEKTPLDRLLAGEKLFVYPAHLAVGTAGAETVRTEHAFDAVMAVETEAHQAQRPARTDVSVNGRRVTSGGETFDATHDMAGGEFYHTTLKPAAAGFSLSGLIARLTTARAQTATARAGAPAQAVPRLTTGSILDNAFVRWKNSVQSPFLRGLLNVVYALYTVVGVNWETVFQIPVIAAVALLPGPAGLVLAVPLALLMAYAFAQAHPGRTPAQRRDLFILSLVMSAVLMVPAAFALFGPGATALLPAAYASFGWTAIFGAMAVHSLYNLVVGSIKVAALVLPALRGLANRLTIASIFSQTARAGEERYIRNERRNEVWLESRAITDRVIGPGLEDFDRFDALHAEVTSIMNDLLAAAGLTPEDYRVYLMDNMSINAFAQRHFNTLGVNMGLLRTLIRAGASRDAIAFVLAHEITHVVQMRDDVDSGRVDEKKGLVDTLAQIRSREYEADLAAISLMDRAGYTVKDAPVALTAIDTWMKSNNIKDSIFGTHPQLEERLRKIQRTITEQYWSTFTKAPTAFSDRAAAQSENRTRFRDFQNRVMAVATPADLEAVLRAARTIDELQFAMLIGFEFLSDADRFASQGTLEPLFRQRAEEFAAGNPALISINRMLAQDIMDMLFRREANNSGPFRAEARTLPTDVLAAITAAGLPRIFFLSVDVAAEDETDATRRARLILSRLTGMTFSRGEERGMMPTDRINRYVTGYLREMGEEFRNRMGRGEVPWPQVKAMLDALILLGLQASDSGVTGGELRIQQIMFPFLASIINNPRFAAEIDTDTMLQIVDLYERSLNHALAPDEGAGTLRRFALVARPEVREAMRQWAMSGERVSAIRNAFIRADIKAHFDGTETLLGSGTTLEYLRALTATPYLAQHNPQGLEQFITAATPRATNAELAAIHQVFFSYIRASGVATDGKGFSDFFFRLMRQDAGDHWDPAFESALLAAVPPGMRDEIAAQSWELKAFLYVLALGGVPSTNELREWAFRRSPAPIPDVNVTNESQAALETLAAPLDPEKEIYTDKPDGIEERARAGTLTDEDTTYLGERLNAIERPVMLDIWNRFQERHPEPVMPWRVSDAQFNLITRFLNANRADLAGRLAGQGADQAAQDESFSHWAMPFYFQALLVELNTGRRLTEDELKYGDLYEPFAGELTLEGVTWTGDQANAAQSRRPRRVSRAEMKDVTPASLTAIFDFLPSLPADFGGAVALVERSLPAGPFRNFVLYLVFVDHVLNGENGLGVAVPEAMDFNAMLARVSGLAGERKERAFEALRRIAPLLVFDRMVSNANQAAAGDNALGRLVGARSAQTDPAVVVPQHAAERAGYDDATYAQPGGLRSQLTAFVGSLAQDDLVRLVAAPIPLNDKLAFITGYFPDATPVRDRWIERALRESNFSGDLATVARALALMSNGSVRDTLALRALERQRTDHPDAFTTLDGALAVIVQLLPEQGPMRDDILNQTAQDLARTPPQFDQIASLMVDPFSKLTRLRGKTEARIVTSRDAFRDYIKQRTPAEKAAFLLWLFGISNDKPYFLVEVEYLYHLDFDGLRTSFRSPPSKLYPDAGRTAQREFLEPFLYGDGGIFSTDASKDLFIDGMVRAIVPAGPNRALIERVFRRSFERADPARREEIVLSLAQNLSQLDVSAAAPSSGEARERREALAIRIFLESLGLVGVKLGQVIAGSPATSAIMKEELKKLKDRARPINKGIVFDTIAKLYGSFGAKFTEVLELLGSASIKVVYRARLEDGREVVIKIKRPDVEKRIQEDLQFLRDVLGDVRPDLEAAGINLPRRLMATIEAIILEELNFDQEKSNQERLKKNVTGFRPIAWVLGFVFNLLIGSVIPAVRGRYRFAVPLALEVKENALMIEEFVSGTSLAAADKLAAQGANVTDLENAAAREFLRQLFVDGFYHADPHAGNLLVSAERGVIYLIDVGAAATISLLGRIRLVRLIRAVAKGNLAGVERFVRALRGEVTPPLRAKIQAALGSNASLATKIVLIFQALDDAGVNLPREMLAVFRFMGAGGELFEGRPTSPQGPSGPSLGRRVLVGVLVVAGIAAAAALTLAAISFAGAAIATAGVAPGAGMSLAGVLLFGLTLNFSETGENGPRRSDDREESARRLADVIVNVASGRSADAIANLQALGSLSIGNLGRGDPTGPFVEQWSRFAQDPAFMALVRAQIGDRLSGLSITEEDLAAVILNALGLGAQAPELLRAGPNAAAPRVFVTRGREAPGVMLAALLKTGLNNETILWVEPGTEAHYSAIANAANRLGGKVTIRPYASGADAGLDGDVFRPERVPTASLPTGVAADAVVFILSDGLRTDGIRANVLLLEQLLPMVDRQRIDAVVKAARLVLINA